MISQVSEEDDEVGENKGFGVMRQFIQRDVGDLRRLRFIVGEKTIMGLGLSINHEIATIFEFEIATSTKSIARF